jgi:hypothetical protein
VSFAIEAEVVVALRFDAQLDAQVPAVDFMKQFRAKFTE